MRPLSLPKYPRDMSLWLRLIRSRAFTICAASAFLLVVLAVVWSRNAGSLDGIVDHAIRLLPETGDGAADLAALQRWENETRQYWPTDRDALVQHIYKRYLDSLIKSDDRRYGKLLAFVSGNSYGRPDDWKRWRKNRDALREGKPLDVPKQQVVKLEKKWEAPIGLTAWFTTMFSIDGQIFVASLGSGFNDKSDDADGIVRVDGRTGEVSYLFSPPPGKGPRDIIGIAASNGGLFASCFNGILYSIAFDGAVRWQSQPLGAPLISAPLSIDINRDGTLDVVVITAAGKVIAVNGVNGKNIWVTPIHGVVEKALPRDPADLIGATLCASNILRSAGSEIVATLPTGQVDVLNAAGGQSRGDAKTAKCINIGMLSGATATSDLTGQRAPAYLADRECKVWALIAPGGKPSLDLPRPLAMRSEETLIAGLRTIAPDRQRSPLVIACLTGNYGSSSGTLVALVGGSDIVWRLNLDGAIWATPAVAELNNDRQPEIVIGTIVPAENDSTVGALSIVSIEGHLLRREMLPAAVECSPLIADVDGDTKMDILVADQSGYLHCFTTTSVGPVEWGTLAGDSRNTRDAVNAYEWGQLPFGRQSKH